MQFTEEKLAKLQSISETISGKEYSGTAELCRLARLGLAAEQVGREDMNDAVDETVFIDWDTMYGIERANLVRAFLNHEAWRK